MRTLLRKIFFEHWERKGISLLLSIIIWFAVSHSQTTTKTLDNVCVRVVNTPPGMTVEGLQSNGLLTKKIPIVITGKRNLLEEITSNDLEAVVDATDKSGEWLVTISKKNLVTLNPDIDVAKAISRITPTRLPVKLTSMVTEKIPVVVTFPTGDPPPDYHFLDIWPYNLSLTLSGPEGIIKKLKSQGLSLTFNLSQISRNELESLSSSSMGNTEEISFAVPNDWKKILIPSLSDVPFELDDPQAKHLRIDFIRSGLSPLNKPIPITLFYPPEYGVLINPETHSLSTGSLIQQLHGIFCIRKRLFAKGVSRLFVELVQDKIDISIILAPKSTQAYLDWSVQFLNPRLLEDKYVSLLLTDPVDSSSGPLFSKKQEEYLRNRFRKYMNRFELYNKNGSKFDMKIELQGQVVQVEELSY